MFNENKSLEERIRAALDLAWTYGTIDGSHHKMWTIDQMVRTLCGSEEEYIRWVTEYEMKLSNGDYYKWDVGIAP